MPGSPRSKGRLDKALDAAVVSRWTVHLRPKAAELPQMGIGPSQRRLEDEVKPVEAQVERHFKAPDDGGLDVASRATIRRRIQEATCLTASAGVSYNKFLAKLASDQRKPDGLFVITPELGPAFVENLPVAKFHGIGPATAARMNELGIHSGADLRARSMDFL